MKRLLVFVVFSFAIVLHSCAPKTIEVTVKGGGEHPFPDWIVKPDRKALQKYKTKTSGGGDILENRFIHVPQTGAQMADRLRNEIATNESYLKREVVLLNTTYERGSEEYEEAQAEIEATREELSEQKEKLAQVDNLKQEDIFTDCLKGWTLTIQLLKDGSYRREADTEDPDETRTFCEEADLVPGF